MVLCGRGLRLCHCMVSSIQPRCKDLHSLAWSWDGVMSPRRDQLWAVSTLLPMLALGKVSGNIHPMSHKAPRDAGWRRARKTELERAAQWVKLRTEGSPEWLLPLVTSPKTGACMASHGTGSVNDKDQAMEVHPLPPCCRHLGNRAAAPRSSEGTGTGGGDQ